MQYQANTVSLYRSSKVSCLAAGTNLLWLICIALALLVGFPSCLAGQALDLCALTRDVTCPWPLVIQWRTRTETWRTPGFQDAPASPQRLCPTGFSKWFSAALLLYSCDFFSIEEKTLGSNSVLNGLQLFNIGVWMQPNSDGLFSGDRNDCNCKGAPWRSRSCQMQCHPDLKRSQ